MEANPVSLIIMPTNTKTLIVIPRLCRGGAELQAIHLANTLANDYSQDVSILSIYPLPSKGILPELSSNVQLFSLSKKQGKLIPLFYTLLLFYKFLRNFSPTKVLLFLSYSEVLYFASYLIGIRCSAYSFVRSGIQPRLSLTYRLLGVFYGSIFRQIFVNSPSNLASTLHMYGRTPIFLPNYISFKSQSSASSINYLSVNLVYVARFIPEKNHEFALSCLQHLLNRGFNATLTFIGASSPFITRAILPSIQSKCLQNHVKIVTDAVNVFSFFPPSPILIFPSYYSEGTPNAILEAFSQSVPVICSSLHKSSGLPCTFYEHNDVLSFSEAFDYTMAHQNELISKSKQYLSELQKIRTFVISSYLI